jgi:autotransporter-associated beta strand protein
LTIEQLEERALLTAGLSAQYFDNADLTSSKLTRIDAAVNFDWGSGSPDALLASDTFSVRWTGRVQAQYSEPYTFYVTADDGFRLWVNHQLIVDNWSSGSTARELFGRTTLEAGQLYDLKLEYYENTGSAAVRLEWSSPSQTRQVVPQAQLSSTTGSDDRGSIQQEIWTGVSGGQVSDLTSVAGYPNQPSGREYLVQFETIQPNWADNYGERLRGYLVPAVTGNYVLAVAGDEQAELYLSTDASPANKQLVASAATATGFREWTLLASQQSAPIALVAGQKYYVEALHKEATGGDHLSVGWQVPGTSQITVIPGDVLIPYGTDTAVPAQGSFLATLAQGRPRLLSTPERFEWLKQQIATAGQMQTWYNTVKSSADSILTMALPEYNQDERGTILTVASTMVDHLYKLALVYRIGGDTRYAERAWQELDAAANFPDWHPAHFLDTAEMTHAFAIGYDWLYDYWTADRRTTLVTNIVSKGLNQALPLYRANSSWTSSTSNNWNLVCNGGMLLGALAIAEQQPTLVEEILARAIPSVRSVMQHFAADAGAWYEGPGYWDYSTRYNTRMLAALESALGSDFGLGQTPGLSEAGLFAVYNTGPTKFAFNFADAGTGIMRGVQLFWFARRYNLPELAWYERTNGAAGPLDLLWYDTRGSDLASAAAPTDLQYRGDTSTFSTQDVVTLRGAWSDPNTTFVGFKAGKMGEAHGCLDAGSFVLDALGQRWAWDLGADDYALPGYFGSQRWNYYRMRAEGHNTLVINPSSAADQKVGATASVFRQETSADASISVANLTAVYNGMSRVWRGVRLSRTDGSLLVEDEIESATAADVWWFMHVKLDPSQVAIAADGTSAVLTQGGNRLWIKILPGSGGQLTLMDPAPLATSPNPSGQNANAGYQKLAIHLQNVTNRRLAVWMVPLSSGEDLPTRLPSIAALADWSTAADQYRWLGDVDGYRPGSLADAVYVDPSWSTAVASATGRSLAGFDTVADAQAVPLTFQFTVPTGQQVTAARLTLGLRSTSGDSTDDRLYLDTTSDGSTYAGLGWTALGTASTARTLDLASRLRLLQDGQLNLATSGNTALDWAQLDLEFGATGLYSFTTLTADADAVVRDGTDADQNFGTGDLATKKDATGENRESYVRFDLSALSGQVTSAMVRLVPTAAGAAAENQLAFVASDAWTESGITWNTRPAASTVGASWLTTAGLPLEADVTALVVQELAGDRRLSLRLSSTTALAAALTNYGSRENADVTLRPQLIVTTLAADARTSLTVTGDAGGVAANDTIRLVGAGGYLDVFVNNTSTVPDFRRDLATLEQLAVTAGAGDDRVTLDYALITLLPSGGLSVDGGDGSDLLSLAGPITVTASTGQLLADGKAIPTSNFEAQAFNVAALNVVGTTVRLGVDNGLASSTDVTISGGGTLDLDGHSTSADAVTLVDGTLSGGTLSGNSFTLQNGTVSTTLAGTGGLTKNTTGKVILSAANSYTGTTLIYQGTLNIRNALALGPATSAVTISCDGATSRYSTLEFEGADFTVENRPLNTTGNGMNSVGALHNVIGNHTWIGPVTLTGGGGGSTYQSDAGTLTLIGDMTTSMIGRTLVLQGAGNGAIVGNIQDGTTVGLPITKRGTGAWTLGGTTNNTYSGTTSVQQGVLVLDKTGAVAVPGTLNVGDGSGNDSFVRLAGSGGNQIADTATVYVFKGETFDLNGRDEAINLLERGTTGSSTGNPLVTNQAAGTTATLSVGAAGGSGGFQGNIQDGAGHVALVKLGTGTFTPKSNYTYTGTTRIDAGTFQLDRPIVSPLEVGAAGLLTGNGGAVTGSITLAGQMAPGPGVGALSTLANAFLLDGGSLTLDVGSSAVDTLAVAGMATLGGRLSIQLQPGFDPALGSRFTVLTAATIQTQSTLTIDSTQAALSHRRWDYEVVTQGANQLLQLVVKEAPTLDADGNGTADALTDGILILRYLFAPSGSWSYNDAVGVGATRSTRDAIKTFLDAGRTSVLDVDGNGTADALTDGILILRYLFAPAGQWNYTDAVGIGATRTTREDLRAQLDQFNPALAAASQLMAAEAPLPAAAPAETLEATDSSVAFAIAESTATSDSPAVVVSSPSALQPDPRRLAWAAALMAARQRDEALFRTTSSWTDLEQDPADLQAWHLVLRAWRGRH